MAHPVGTTTGSKPVEAGPRVLDELELAFDAVDTSAWTISAHNGTAINHTISSDQRHHDTDPGRYMLKWPSINSAGSATIVLSIQDSADGSTGWATIATGPAMDFDAAAPLPSPDGSEIMMPKKHRQYTRLVVTVAVAALTGGALSAGFRRE